MCCSACVYQSQKAICKAGILRRYSERTVYPVLQCKSFKDALEVSV